MPTVRGLVVALLAPGAALAQQAGTLIEEVAPSIPLQRCTLAEGCKTIPAKVTIDAVFRWVHEKTGHQGCLTEHGWNRTLCPDGRACAETCAIEGIGAESYEKVFGVRSLDTGVELEYVTEAGNIGSRLYVTNGEDSYHMFKLKNREFTFEVDVSSLACGINGAVYFVAMDEKGDHGEGGNAAGAKFGTGYCDAQCFGQRWEKGHANIGSPTGMCCTEMDIWEANRAATAFTPHPCTVEGAHRCNGIECGKTELGERYMGVCDKDGCDMNAYRLAATKHYGPGADFEVDTTKPMTVVTQFHTTNETDAGELSEIRRFYVQDGKVIAHASSAVPGVEGSSITDDFCSKEKKAFQAVDSHAAKGGLAQMGKALDRGMVLALSLWDDASSHMRWLDSTWPADADPSRPGVTRGPCDGNSSHPSYLRTAHKSATVKYMNIRYGEIGSTTSEDTNRRLSAAILV